MSERPSDEEIFAKAQKIKDILEEYFPQDPAVAAPKINEALGIKRELETMGFLVQWQAALNAETLVCEVEVRVYKPKENMSPEDAALYDAWLIKR